MSTVIEERKAAIAEYRRKYQKRHKEQINAYNRERIKFIASKPYFYEVKGKPFRDARERKGVSIRAASKASGLSVSNIWNWENGYCSPTPENLKKIADYYGVEPNSLLA